MATLSSRKIEDLVAKTAEFIREIQYISNVIEDNDIYKIRYRLSVCTNHLIDNLQQGLMSDERINKLRAYIKIYSSLEECKNYLNLVNRLNYYPTEYAESELEKINQEIKDSYQIALN